MDHTQTLPDDLLADILRHLPPCDLAASRCVRKAWHAVVDAHRLLLPHVLPHAVRGLYVNYVDYHRAHFLARPSSRQPAVNGNLRFLLNQPDRFDTIVDHCNGLLLMRGLGSTLCVVNPATRCWEVLPWEDENANPHLVFDPAASPQHEVFSIPRVPMKTVFNLSGTYSSIKLPNDDESAGETLVEEHDFQDRSTQPSSKQYKQKSNFSTISESLRSESGGEHEDPDELVKWPPSLWTLNVFSSNTRQWQVRSFVREGDSAGTMATARLESLEPWTSCWGRYGGPRRRYSVYWQGSLFVHCHGASVVRLSLSDCKYRVIKFPVDSEKTKHAQFLGKSEKGVYLATLHDGYKLRLWTLTESSGCMHWVLKYHIDLEPWAKADLRGPQDFGKTWTMADDDDIHYYHDDDYEDDDEEEEEEEDLYAHADVELAEEHEEGVQNENNEMVSEDHEWNSDDDNIVNIEDYDTLYGGIIFFGFHPYKEIIFLDLTKLVGVAYHLKTSKVQYLGEIRAKDYDRAPTNSIYESFPYTPCMLGELLNLA